MASRAVLYFVKYPEPGKVKIRLAKTIGNEQAVQVYRELAENNFKVCLDAQIIVDGFHCLEKNEEE